MRHLPFSAPPLSNPPLCVVVVLPQSKVSQLSAQLSAESQAKAALQKTLDDKGTHSTRTYTYLIPPLSVSSQGPSHPLVSLCVSVSVIGIVAKAPDAHRAQLEALTKQVHHHITHTSIGHIEKKGHTCIIFPSHCLPLPDLVSGPLPSPHPSPLACLCLCCLSVGGVSGRGVQAGEASGQG